jgi:uncharacterized membrane protein
MRNLVRDVRTRVKSALFDLGDTLWFVPAIMTSVAVALAFSMLAVDRNLLAGQEVVEWALFSGGAEGARGVLTTIASTMITVATTAFSITLVALQLASSQYSPRILRGFTGDRGNQVVLGTFIATFAYTIVIFRAIKSPAEDRVAFVPSASVTVAILLAFAAIGSLIYFFHHATRVIQASVVIDRTTQDVLGLVSAHARRHEANSLPGVTSPLDRDDTVPLPLDRAGYVVSLDYGTVARAAAEHRMVLTMVVQVGDYLLSSTPVVEVPASHWSTFTAAERDNIRNRLRSACQLDMERTLEHDVRFGFRQLSDIVIRALSPGVNDPTTAITAINSLGESLLQARDFPTELRYQAAGDDGGVRFWTVGFDQLIDETLPQIRHYGAADATVMSHLLVMLREVSRDATENVRGILEQHGRQVIDEALASIQLPADRHHVRAAARWIPGMDV